MDNTEKSIVCISGNVVIEMQHAYILAYIRTTYITSQHNCYFAIAFVPPCRIAHNAGNRWIERQPNFRYSPYKLVHSIFSICSSVLCCICATFHPQHRNQFCVVVKISVLNWPNLLPFIAIHACSHSFAIPKYSHFMFYSSQSNCDNDNTLANIIFLSPIDSPMHSSNILNESFGCFCRPFYRIRVHFRYWACRNKLDSLLELKQI